MNKFQIRIFKGSAIIILGMIAAILMTFVYDWLVSIIGNEKRLGLVFGVGGFILAIATIFSAVLIWTNNFGEGMNKIDK